MVTDVDAPAPTTTNPPVFTQGEVSLERLAVTGSSERQMYPQFDPGTFHYGIGCSDQDMLTLMLSTKDADTRLAVNGSQQASNQNAEVELTGVNSNSDIVIHLSDSGGATGTYFVHCLADDFPVIAATDQEGVARVDDGLIMISTRARNSATSPWWSYIAMIDNNGVPRFRRRIDARVVQFKPHVGGKHPFSYMKAVGTIPSLAAGGEAPTTYEAVVLDENLDEVQTVRTVGDLQHTDNHDFAIKENGNYVLMAYEPTRRDLSDFTDEGGNPYSTTEGTRDSVIQEVTPEGVEVFRWNSWDHLAIEDCTQHRFPDDYAHVNSLQVVNGDIVASFRGCSQVLRIDGTTGDVIWRLGQSNRSDADWTADSGTPPLAIVDDPHGEFCGQHAARVIDNGNLLLFDNGGHCLVDPETGDSQRQGGVFSRAVEYSLGLDEGEATFVRHHSLHSAFDRYARSQAMLNCSGMEIG